MRADPFFNNTAVTADTFEKYRSIQMRNERRVWDT